MNATPLDKTLGYQQWRLLLSQTLQSLSEGHLFSILSLALEMVDFLDEMILWLVVGHSQQLMDM